jgi:hypothetical protein
MWVSVFYGYQATLQITEHSDRQVDQTQLLVARPGKQ